MHLDFTNTFDLYVIVYSGELAADRSMTRINRHTAQLLPRISLSIKPPITHKQLPNTLKQRLHLPR
jgi:hypothetical protein